MTTQPPAGLDPRRYFTTEEVTAAWLLQDRQCRECRRDVPCGVPKLGHLL